MPTLRWDVSEPADAPLDAAARFYARDLPGIRDCAEAHPDHDIALVLAPATREHRAWRLAAVQELAREFAPRRVNGIVGDEEDGIVATIAYLGSAPGVTGQLLAVA